MDLKNLNDLKINSTVVNVRNGITGKLCIEVSSSAGTYYIPIVEFAKMLKTEKELFEKINKKNNMKTDVRFEVNQKNDSGKMMEQIREVKEISSNTCLVITNNRVVKMTIRD